MLTVSLPDTLTTLLAGFAPCFTAPTLRTFQALVAGFLAQPGLRTVTGMLVGARLAGQRHHDLAYRFFASARWSADQLGLVLLDLITSTLIPAGAPLLLAVDDTLWRRSGPTLHGAAWHHDGNGPGRHRPAWGHRWVVVGAIAHLPFVTRAVCLPILARLWIPGDSDHTPLILARELVDLVVHHVGDHPLHLVGDAAYIGKPLQALPAQVTVTARLRCDAALYAPPPLHTGRRGRPRVKGDRLPELIMLAGMTRYRWTPVQVRCCGTPGPLRPGLPEPGHHLVRPPRPPSPRPGRPPRPRALVPHQAHRLGRRHARLAAACPAGRPISAGSPRPAHPRPIPRRPTHRTRLRRITPKLEVRRRLDDTGDQAAVELLSPDVEKSGHGVVELLPPRSMMHWRHRAGTW
jgi:DDE superfamily endonuclease